MTTTRPDLSPLSLAVDRAMAAAKVLDWEAFDRSDKTLPADAYLMDPVPCLGCKGLTYGCFSYGGAHLRSVCRPCKSAADRQEERQLEALVGAIKLGEALARPQPKHTCRLCHSLLPAVDGRCVECHYDGKDEGDTRSPGHSERERCDGLPSRHDTKDEV